MPHTLIPRRNLYAVIAGLLLAAAPVRAQAVQYTWNGGGPDANWSTALNWSASPTGPLPPVSDLNNTFLLLTGANQLTNTLDYTLSANSLEFDAAAGAFVVNGSGANTLTIGSGGISVTSNNNQTINANLATGAGGSGIWANDGAGVFLVAGPVNISASSLLLGGSGNSVYSGIISGGNGLQKIANGTVTLAGVNTYTGTTAVTQGVLSISADNNLGAVPGSPTPNSLLLNGGALSATASFTLNANRGIVVGTGSVGGTGTINVAPAQTLTYNGIIANNGSSASVLQKTGAGTLILGGASTYSGGTTLNGGTVLVNGQSVGTSGTGSGAVAVNNTAILGGTGRIGGAVTVNSGGTIRGGDAGGVGTLTLGSGLVLTTGAQQGFRITSAGAPAAVSTGGSSTGTNNNFLDITGGLNPTGDTSTYHFFVDGTGAAFNPSQSYSYQVALSNGQDVSFINLTNQAQFTPIGFSDPFNFSLTGNNLGAVYLNMAPVPEPTMVLGLAAGAMGLGGLVRRRLRRA